MDRKVIITKWNQKIVTSVLEDGEMVEIHCSGIPADSEFCHSLGNIYVGRVKNIVQNIGAAFIEIAPGLECYYAMGQNKRPHFTKKIGKKPLCIGDELLVQISREASKTKAPTVTAKLDFAGQYAVLSYGSPRIGISQKLDPDTRLRLKALMQPYKNEEYGFIVRTNARDVDDQVIAAEVNRLTAEYEHLMQTADSRVCFSCLKKAPAPYITDVKNIYMDGLTELKVEGLELYEEVRAYLLEQQPQNLDKLQLYEGNTFPLSKLYSLDQVIERALKERVWLKCGGYLVIQPTEALTVIDVNSGKYISRKEENASYLKINLEAAKEAAKQIRLRNLSGIVIIDFINLDEEEDTQLLLKKLREYLAHDPIQTTLVDVTKLHLVEITRKKVRKMLYETI